MTINGFRGEYRFLSNFQPSPLSIRLLGEDRLFLTVEHAFQGAKVLACPMWSEQQKKNWLAVLVTERDPVAVKRMGRKIPIDVDDWNSLHEKVMLTALRLKFRDPLLASRLRATADAALIEDNSWGDTYWGQVNGKGKNRLGALLMRVRTELQEQES